MATFSNSWTWAAVALCAALSASGQAQLTEDERKGIEDTLSIGNMTLEDLSYQRRPVESSLMGSLNKTAIDAPLSGLDAWMAGAEKARGKSPSEVLAQCAAMLDLGTGGTSASLPAGVDSPFPKDFPEPLKPLVTRLAKALQKANSQVRLAEKNLTPAELRALIEGLPRVAVGSPLVSFDFVSSPMPKESDITALARKVDLATLQAAAVELSKETEAILPQLVAFAKTTAWAGTAKLKIADQVIVVAGVGDDTHRDKDARLVVDLGGNDRYFGRNGAGIGYAALSIDLSGDDSSKLPDASMGCGLVGIGLAYDLGGHDTFRGKSLALGCGMAGVGMMYKDGGDDVYRCDSLAEGFGFFGTGLLIDTRGKDMYSVGIWGQGAARPCGLGRLIDSSGDDTYRSGGVVPHSPLFTTVTKSCSQGYAEGLDDDPSVVGGIGVLNDFGGSDLYDGETLCQGAGSLQGVGCVYDAEGADTYRAYHFSQGFGTSSGAGYLVDLSGDDSYVVNFGASHALGQDFGVGVLFDRAGSDVYAGRESRPGSGNANGLGLFVDVSGEDRYAGPPGVGNPARSMVSLGVFADLAGPDQYRDGLSDAEAAVSKTVGVAFDREGLGQVSTTSQDPGDVKPPAPGSIAVGTQMEVSDLFDRSLSPDAKVARDAINRLIGMGVPAVRMLIEERLAHLSSNQRSVLGMVADASGSDARLLVAMKIASKDLAEARNALRISIEIESSEAGPYVPPALDNPELQRLAVEAAGASRSRDSVAKLLPLAASPDRWLSRNVLLALVKIGDPQSLGTAQALMSSPDLLTRQAAMDAVAQGSAGLAVAKTMLESRVEREVRQAIDLLGRMGTDEALKLVGQKLLDERRGVRISALLALNGRAPAEFRQQVLERRKDPDALVRAVAARIDPGR